MPRKLEFIFGNEAFAVAIHKVDRSKVYGRVAVSYTHLTLPTIYSV